MFVLMGTLQNSTHSKVLANTAKHFAFTRCSELNLYGMVDAQIAVVGASYWRATRSCLDVAKQSESLGWNPGPHLLQTFGGSFTSG